MKTLSYVLALLPDGSLDIEKCNALHTEVLAKIKADMDTDFASVAVGVNAFLIANPGLKTCSTSSFCRALHEANLENGVYVHPEGQNDDGSPIPSRPFTRQEKDLAYARLETVVPEYLRSLPNQFHTGRKNGVAIRFVEGETMKDNDGADMYDGQGNVVQAFRHTAEEWTKITTPSEKALAKIAAAAAEAAKVTAAKK